ncbi:serine hydrolase [Iningainema tapete]|uniref:Serine hydrolase n=1 Tax=Iningainema tapete BLCC-T55 TaxID=2748662 RepID=A0A8J6XE63_9CYAN|nr:serine hydrolase [Iningainema tapete]MBD2774680.1 serine hydrolase [Iningainema tapete BLCC-T55]
MTKAITRSHQQQFQNGIESLGLAWQIITLPEGQEIYCHNGGTGGYKSFIGFDKKHQTGVVILSNYGDAMANDFSVDAMAVQILKHAAKIPLN